MQTLYPYPTQIEIAQENDPIMQKKRLCDKFVSTLDFYRFPDKYDHFESVTTETKKKQANIKINNKQ